VFSHVTLGVADLEVSERFYGAVLAVLGVEPTAREDDRVAWGDFAVAAAGPGRPVTRRLHLGFSAPSRAHVDAFWQAGVDAGFRDDGAPGDRPEYTLPYYGGFLLDPDGNSAEAVHHDALRSDGRVDHLWIRVPDLAASRAFYAGLAPRAGFTMRRDTPERVAFDRAGDGGGTFSILPGEPTEGLHVGFPAAQDEVHRAPDGARVELVRSARGRY
jgi:catechol 2,3-dioxygenase-like lactoylglutathione lyase family enzyme